MELIVGFVLEDGEHKGVVLVGLALWVCSPAQRDGKRVGCLVNRLQRRTLQLRQIPLQALVIRLCAVERQVFAHTAVGI